MAQLLKVDEWQGASGNWYVNDIHAWATWNQIAKIFGHDTLKGYTNLLADKYHAKIDKICKYPDKPTLIIFHWSKSDYRYAHQFKLDTNRIARNTNYMVEKNE